MNKFSSILPLIAMFTGILAFPSGCLAQTAPQGVTTNETDKSKKTLAVPVRQARAAHTASMTDDGSVLIVGGFAGGKVGISETEIFDIDTGEFVAGPPLSVGRSGHTATRLRDGRILIAGGFNGDYLDSAEIYDPKTRRFLSAGKLTMPRSEHISVLLPNGEVLLAGGVGTNWTFLSSAEIYNPSTNSFRRTGSMTTERESHTATLLKDGKVLIAGGHRGRRAAMEIYRSAEIFDPRSGTFTSASQLTIRRHKHDAVLLTDGRVLIIGGSDERDSRGAYTSIEIYDPKTRLFSSFGDLKLPRYKIQGSSLALNNGKVLVTGGAARAELIDTRTNRSEFVSDDFGVSRFFSTATQLNDGRVLIVGGYGPDISAQTKALLMNY